MQCGSTSLKSAEKGAQTMIQRLIFLAVTGALMDVLEATATFAQEENGNNDVSNGEQPQRFLLEGHGIYLWS